MLADSIFQPILSVLYQFAQGVTTGIADAIASVFSGIGSQIASVFVAWGEAIGIFGFWVPAVLVTGLMLTAAIAYTVFALGDVARAALAD